MRVVVLVNGHSASASEILAGVLQYQKRAIIVGEKTFGKGCAQTVLTLHSVPGTGFKLTTHYFYFDYERKRTPEKVGIMPDIQIANQEGSSVDLQLNTALDYFRSHP